MSNIPPSLTTLPRLSLVDHHALTMAGPLRGGSRASHLLHAVAVEWVPGALGFLVGLLCRLVFRTVSGCLIVHTIVVV